MADGPEVVPESSGLPSCISDPSCRPEPGQDLAGCALGPSASEAEPWAARDEPAVGSLSTRSGSTWCTRRSSSTVISPGTWQWVRASIRRLLQPLFDKRADPEVLRSWLPSHVLAKRNRHQAPRRAQLAGTQAVQEYEGKWIRRQRRRLRKFLQSKLYGLVSCSVILANAVFIGIEQTKVIRGDTSTPIVDSEYFIGFYVFEICLLLTTRGRKCLREDSWVQFDAVILCLQISTEFVPDSYLRTHDSLLLLRLVKLAPLVRTLRPILWFRVLKVLVRALLCSAGLVFNTVLLLALFLYIFGVLGTEIIGLHRYANGPEAISEFHDIASTHFSSIPGSILTLVQFVCLDNIALIYRPLVRHDPGLTLYFVAVILVVPIMLMNLVTALIVSSTQEHIKQDQADGMKYAKSKLARRLHNIFEKLGVDQYGSISHEDIWNLDDEDREVLKSSCNTGNLETIFNALDPEETGAVDLEDFCNSAWQLATSKISIEAQVMEKQMASNLRRLNEVSSRQATMTESLGRARKLQHSLKETLRLQSSAWCTPIYDEVGWSERNEVPAPDPSTEDLETDPLEPEADPLQPSQELEETTSSEAPAYSGT